MSIPPSRSLGIRKANARRRPSSEQRLGPEVGHVDDSVRAALSRGGTIDITTTGQRTGQPRRIEIVFHRIDGRMWISGLPRPRKRAWLANLEADPHLVVHLK